MDHYNGNDELIQKKRNASSTTNITRPQMRIMQSSRVVYYAVFAIEVTNETSITTLRVI